MKGRQTGRHPQCFPEVGQLNKMEKMVFPRMPQCVNLGGSQDKPLEVGWLKTFSSLIIGDEPPSAVRDAR